MSTKSVSDWLQDHDLGHYSSTFENENFNRLDQLPFITENYLSEMNIKIGDRVRFKQAVAETLCDKNGRAGQTSERCENEISLQGDSVRIVCEDPAIKDLADVPQSDIVQSLQQVSEKRVMFQFGNLRVSFEAPAKEAKLDKYPPSTVRAIQAELRKVTKEWKTTVPVGLLGLATGVIITHYLDKTMEPSDIVGLSDPTKVKIK